jgi:queuine/archaeosine tRNA-ribosyltransferase
MVYIARILLYDIDYTYRSLQIPSALSVGTKNSVRGVRERLLVEYNLEVVVCNTCVSTTYRVSVVSR